MLSSDRRRRHSHQEGRTRQLPLVTRRGTNGGFVRFGLRIEQGDATMKTLMTATAVAALIAAYPAFGQTQDRLQNPTAGESPAATEPMAVPEAPAEIMPSDGAQPDTGAAAESQAPDEAVASSDRFVGQQGEDETLASTLIGTSIYNEGGDALGDINDLVMSEGGQVGLIVIGVGGFLGIGEKNVGVPFDSIERYADENGNVVLILNASAEELEAAPRFVTINELQQQQQMEQPAAPAPDAMAPAAPEQPSQ
jgi:sporulation protein YlmC with PRC-barrel domain